MLASENESEVVATVRAIQRVLVSYNFSFHDLAASLTITSVQPVNKPAPTPNQNKYSSPSVMEVLWICEEFRKINTVDGKDASFIENLYVDITILGANYHLSHLETERLYEIKRRYRI